MVDMTVAGDDKTVDTLFRAHAITRDMVLWACVPLEPWEAARRQHNQRGLSMGATVIIAAGVLNSGGSEKAVMKMAKSE